MFRLIAIEVLNPQSIEMVESPRYKSVHKILSLDAEDVQNHKTSKFYYFHKGYSCENGQTTVHQPAETLDDCFFTNSGVRISVSSIVGENGMGKSSLIELFFRLINNVAFALKGGIDKGVSYNLLFVPDVYGRGYFEDSDGSF